MKDATQVFDDLRAALATAERAIAPSYPLPPRHPEDLHPPTVDEFRAWRDGLGMSGAAAAAIFGVSPSTVRAWERSAAPNPFDRTAARLLYALQQRPALVYDFRRMSCQF